MRLRCGYCPSWARKTDNLKLRPTYKGDVLLCKGHTDRYDEREARKWAKTNSQDKLQLPTLTN